MGVALASILMMMGLCCGRFGFVIVDFMGHCLVSVVFAVGFVNFQGVYADEDLVHFLDCKPAFAFVSAL